MNVINSPNPAIESNKIKGWKINPVNAIIVKIKYLEKLFIYLV